MAKRVAVSRTEVGFNMTPMIDCTFQLIIFFILASQVANDAYAQNVEIQRPHTSQAIPPSVAKFNKVTINVVSKAAGEERPDAAKAAEAGMYKIGTKKFEVGQWDQMIELVKTKKAEFDEQIASGPAASGDGDGDDGATFFLEIRADKRVKWADVAPVIRVGVNAGLSKLVLTALTEQK